MDKNSIKVVVATSVLDKNFHQMDKSFCPL